MAGLPASNTQGHNAPMQLANAVWLQSCLMNLHPKQNTRDMQAEGDIPGRLPPSCQTIGGCLRFLLACSGATGGAAGSSPSSGSSATSAAAAAVAGTGPTAPLAFKSLAASRAKALRHCTQTQHSTDRLHSSDVSPRSAHQGLRLGTTEKAQRQGKQCHANLGSPV